MATYVKHLPKQVVSEVEPATILSLALAWPCRKSDWSLFQDKYVSIIWIADNFQNNFCTVLCGGGFFKDLFEGNLFFISADVASEKLYSENLSKITVSAKLYMYPKYS